MQDQIDLVHVPYFTIPIFFPKKIVVTVHDLILSHFVTGKASTLPTFHYLLKRIGYETLMRVGLTKATKIIAVSQATALDIAKTYGYTEKIVVIPEGIDHILKFKDQKSKVKNRAGESIKNFIKFPYILYVGNAYPHKNLEMLLRSFSEVLTKKKENIRLALVGKQDFFYSGIQKSIDEKGLSGKVKIFHDVSDQDLTILYANACVSVSLSLSEGFGFPVLEALSLGSRVVCSDIPVFHEVASHLPVYVDPTNVGDISRALIQCIEDSAYKVPGQKDIASLGKKFQWKNAAIKTKSVYESSALGNV
jgi:glycosyltransferase involved in cell wall biosynthesis